jgi:hypothetical protein
MKVKITMDRSANSSRKATAITKINQSLGSKAVIAGDVITVDEGNIEQKVIEILDRADVPYARSK